MRIMRWPELREESPPFASVPSHRLEVQRPECYAAAMDKPDIAPVADADFSTKERDYIRRELDMFFSTLPTVAEGFMLRTWRGGPQAGQPKVPPVAQGLLDRGLMRLDTTQHMPRLFFTEAGLGALRAMMADRRFADPKKFAHVRQELGLE
jgi:hypothetical protein